jgi:MFS family permease
MSALFGASVGIGSIFSQLLAGVASDWLTSRGERWRAYWCTVSLWAGLPFILMVIFGSTPVATIGMFMIAIVTGGATTTSMIAGLSVVRPSMRGFMTAMMMVCILGVGGGLGPLVIGALSDTLKHAYGDQAIRYTLIFVPVCWLLSGLLFWFAGRTTDRDAALAAGEAAPAGI